MKNEILKLNTQEVRNIQLQLLSKFIDICEKNNINYILYGGTLIGAVRHSGYIPWDDDIDLSVSRKDFNLLFKKGGILEKNLEGSNKIYSKLTNKKCPYLFGKIYDTNTKCIILNNPTIDNHLGVYIDVIPLDGIPVKFNIDKHKNFLKNIVTIGLLRSKSLHKTTLIENQITKKFILKNLIYKLFYLIPIGFMVKNYFSNKNFDNNSFIGQYTSRKRCNQRFNKSLLSNYTYHKFEYLSARIPVDYDHLLRTQYGDYMKLPPKEDQIPVHSYIYYKMK